MIRQIQIQDTGAICDIYNYYILNSFSTFEAEPVKPVEMENRIQQNTTGFPWLVYIDNDEIIGYAYATAWKNRAAYKRSAETSVYLKHGCHGKGVGTQLYSELIELLKALNIHAIIGGIALPNDSSIHLHEKFGFEKVAHFREVGFKFGAWRDVGYWELIIN
jgi:phosphinothricin acetyltransferase